MILLAFETSSNLGSVAVGDGSGDVLARRFLGRQAAHASALLPAVAEALEEAGIDRAELEGVVVGAGPGSFTGLRVGAATAKGLVRALGIPLRGVSSLAAGAVTAGLEETAPDGSPPDLPGARQPRYVLFDARGDRVYGACYRLGPDGLETLVEPHGGRLDEVLEGRAPTESLFCGSGARRHAQRIREAGFPVLPEPGGIPTADALLRLVRMDPDDWMVEDPGRWEPEYLRRWKPGWER